MNRNVSILMGAFFLSVASVQAAAPIPYGEWTATVALDGTSVITDSVTSLCQTGVAACEDIATGDGFRYQRVTIANEEYTHMVMLDPGASGDSATLGFSNETFTPVKIRNKRNRSALTGSNNNGPWVFADDKTTYARAAQGIASRMVTSDAEVKTVAEIQRGFARDIIGQNDAGPGSIADPLSSATGQAITGLSGTDAAQRGWSTKLTQTLVSGDITAGFSSIRWTETPQSQATAGALNTDTERGKIQDIFQNIASGASVQKFDRRRREGRGGYQWFCQDGSFPDCNNYALTAGGSATVNGAATTWNAGGRVVATWVASTIGGAVSSNNIAAADLSFVCNGFFSPFLGQCFPGFAGGPTWAPVYTPTATVSATKLAAIGPGAASWAPDVNWPLVLANVADPFAATEPRTTTPTIP